MLQRQTVMLERGQWSAACVVGIEVDADIGAVDDIAN